MPASIFLRPPERPSGSPFRKVVVVPVTLMLLAGWGCAGAEGPPPPPDPVAERAVFWSSLQALCDEAFQGTVVRDTPSTPDSPFQDATLVMHVRECTPDEIRIPFHVGGDRSRTWVLTRLDGGFRLKHHHLHEDGAPDEVHLYGGESAADGTGEWQEFPADPFTAELIPAAAGNVWTVEVVPGELFAYALRREGTERAFRVEFDLTRPVPHPPAPWGG